MFTFADAKKCNKLKQQNVTMIRKRTIHCYIVAGMALLMGCQESMEERAAREAREYTEKHCPTPVAKDVVMDSMVFDRASHTLGYYYTLGGVLDDTAYVSRSNAYENVLNELRNSTHLKIYKEAAYSFRYVYFSKKERGTKLFDATYHESDYR